MPKSPKKEGSPSKKRIKKEILKDIKEEVIDFPPQAPKVNQIFFLDGEYYTIENQGEISGQYGLFHADCGPVNKMNFLRKVDLKEITLEGRENQIQEGKGFELLNGNCKKVGSWKEGEFSGSKNVFYYPDGTKIVGEVEEDEFVSGAYYTPSGKKIKNLKLDFANRESMPLHVHDKDPYEQKFVTVKKVKGKGEGLFAKRFIKEGDLCSLYPGLLVPHYIVDRRRWEFNDNTIEVDTTFSIDIPKPFHKLSKYSASLGHKANHSFEPNASYMYLEHPKFGDIMSVVAIRDIQKDEEIVVNYGYAKHARGPKWFREERKKWEKEKKRREKEEIKLMKKRKKLDNEKASTNSKTSSKKTK